MVFNCAHRGASAYAPENTFAAFYLAIEMEADGIETDVRRTQDNVLVLFHDRNLKRITGKDGSISDFTYTELLDMDFGSYKGKKYKNERIVSLRDMLKYLSGKDLKFILELKDKNIENDVFNIIREFKCVSKTTITSFDLQTLKNFRILDEKIEIGYLTDEITEDILKLLDSLRIKQICPNINFIDYQKVKYAQNSGFSVRCWGIKTVELMYKALECEVDGMTVDFPDKLAEIVSKNYKQR